MNYISKLSFAGLLIASSSLFAVEPAMGWYGGLFVGPSMLSGSDVTITSPLAPFLVYNPSIEYSILVNGGGQVGYRCNKFRFEGELLYDINNISKITGFIPLGGSGINLSSNNIKGETWILGGLFNAYYEFYDIDYSETRWVPYVGLGIGYAQINSTLDYQFVSSPLPLNPSYQVNSISNAPIGQGILGASYFFSDISSIGVDLRYFTTGLNIKNNINTEFNSRVSGFSLNLVFNYTFGQSNY